MTDWDNLEGDELNLPLARLAGWHGEVVRLGGASYLFPPGVKESEERWWDRGLPNYASSVDLSIRDLVPLLGSDGTWQVGRDIKKGFTAFVSTDWARSLGSWHSGPTPGTALARALGKALEARGAA